MTRKQSFFVLVIFILTSAKCTKLDDYFDDHENIKNLSKFVDWRLFGGNIKEHHDFKQKTLKLSLLQRIQEQENKMIQSQLAKNLTRIESGFYKIFNVSPYNEKNSTKHFKPEISNQCRAKGYCESIPNYPVERVTKLLEELGDAVNNFHLDKLDDSEIGKRRKDSEDNITELCVSHIWKLYPEALQGTDGKWYAVVNRKNKPIQGFLADICEDLDSKCSNQNLIHDIQLGYKVHCHQNFVDREVVVLDRNLQMFFKSCKIPTCCTCVYSTTDAYL